MMFLVVRKRDNNTTVWEHKSESDLTAFLLAFSENERKTMRVFTGEELKPVVEVKYDPVSKPASGANEATPAGSARTIDY